MLWHRRPLHYAASPLLEQLALLGCSSQSAVGKIKTVELAGPLRTVQRPLVIHTDHSGLPQVICKAPALRLPAVLHSPGRGSGNSTVFNQTQQSRHGAPAGHPECGATCEGVCAFENFSRLASSSLG